MRSRWQRRDAAEKRVALDAADARIHVVLAGDARRLTQLLHNLIGNAIKFTPSGGRVAVRVTATDGTARLEVEDSGLGHLRRRIRSISTSASTARRAPSGARIPGTGLGLAIVKAIVDAHGGVDRRPQRTRRGTTFTIELPGVGIQ